MSYFNDISFVNVTKMTASNYTSPPIKTGSYSIEYISEGSTYFINNGKRIVLKAPVVFWMLLGKNYQFLPVDDKPVEHYWADFYGARAERMLKCLSERIPGGMTVITRPIEFEMIFEEMIKIYKDSPFSRRYELAICLERLMGFVYSSTLDSETENIKYDFIADMADEMKFSPMKEYDFRVTARKNSLSYDHFRKLFREYNGMAPYDYLLQCRMEHAAKILQEDEVSIKELAELFKFEDISSFSRIFKRKMGVSPSNYLNMYKRR